MVVCRALGRILAILIAYGIYILTAFSAHANVLFATRVIYHPAEGQYELLVRNPDPIPKMIHVWIDRGDSVSTPDKSDHDFSVTPVAFRIEPDNGQQAVRLRFAGKPLPKDQESLYYLNILEAPPRERSLEGHNQMVVIFRSRIKLFYRPDTVVGTADEANNKIQFVVQPTAKGWTVTASNPSGYHVSLNGGQLKWQHKTLLFGPVMILPFSEEQWEVADDSVSKSRRDMVIEYRVLNDFGAEVLNTATVHVAAVN